MESLSNAKYIKEFLFELNERRKEDKFTDVTLICQGTKLTAHKVVLSASCAYFKSMFSGHFAESEKDVDLGKQFTPLTWQMLLDYIYTGIVALSPANVIFFMELATYLQLITLIEMCVDFISKNLDINNCLKVKHFALEQDNVQLYAAAEEFIACNLEQLFEVSSFLEIDGKEIAQILQKDILHVHSNDRLLKGLELWTRQQLPERLNELPHILTQLDSCDLTKHAIAAMDVLSESSATLAWQRKLLSSKEYQQQWRLFTLEQVEDLNSVAFKSYDSQFGAPKNLAQLDCLEYSWRLSHHGQHIFAHGCTKGTKPMYYYSLVENTWHALANMVKPRFSAGSVVLDGGLFTLGGRIPGSSLASATVERLDLATCASHEISSLRIPRIYAGCTTADGCIYIVSGESTLNELSGIEHYDPRVGVWFYSYAPKIGYCSAVAKNNQVYVMDLEAYSVNIWDRRSLSWHQQPIEETVNVSHLCRKDDKLYAAGVDGITEIDMQDFTMRKVFTTSMETSLEFYAASSGNVTI